MAGGKTNDGPAGGPENDRDSDLPTVRSCAVMTVHHRLLETDSRYAENRQRIEELAFRAESGMLAQRTGCTKIPVVVHIVHRLPAENITKAQIESQIRVLNEDFRKKNADVSGVPAPFAALAADSRLMFELATVDPSGNPTEGITRTSTTTNGFSSDDRVKAAATGGADPWPADRYLNIWVCKLSGGLLGYAQFPGGPAATDGVVCTHTGFGTEGTAAAPFNKGRTTTHEIGHWLNLRHIWGDDGDGCGGSDFVSDTPNQGGPNTGVPGFPKVSCSNGPSGDMFMNYMDYTDDAGMFMFTAGQVARMQACLDGPRSSIGSSVPCGPVGPKFPIKDSIKDGGKDVIKDAPKDGIKDGLKDGVKEPIKESAKELPKDAIKDSPKDGFKDSPKDRPKDLIKDSPKDFAKDAPKDRPKEFVKERPKDLLKDRPKEGIFDPPKTIFENPKGPFENPKGFDGGPLNPQGPFGGLGFGGQGGGATPFVLGGGRQDDGTAEQVLAVGGQVLEALAMLAQAGLLTSEGLQMGQSLEALLAELGARGA